MEKVSQEQGFSIINKIIYKREEEKQRIVQDVTKMFQFGASYSTIHDLIDRMCLYSMGKIIGMYDLAYYLDVLDCDEMEQILNDLNQVFDVDILIESAINRGKCFHDS